MSNYPAEIIEAVGAALHAHTDREYVAGAWPEGPFAGWGWVCQCGTPLRFEEGHSYRAGVAALTQCHDRHRARAALEALGLTATEQFHVDYKAGSGYGSIVGEDVADMLERQRRVTFGDIVVQQVSRRTTVQAMTEWQEIDYGHLEDN